MKYDSSELCPECEILRPKRSRHCEICNRCVYVFDHHCPFINNCVGAKNHKYFLFFLISLWLEILYKMFFIGLDLLDKDLQYIYIFKYTDSDIFLFKIFVSVGLLILSCTIFLPLSILLWTHINNFTLNKTSSERFGFKKKEFSDGNLEEINSINNNNSSVNASFEIDVNEKSKKGESNFYNYIKNCYLMCYPPLQN